MGRERKLKSPAKFLKTVQNARGGANFARVQEGGGRAQQLVILSVLSSRDTSVHTARYGSSRRRCSFLHPRGVKMDRLDGHPELKKWDIVGAQRFLKRPKKRAPRRPNGAKRPKFTDTG